ncbi:hypothetical protein D3C84_1166010 [compost metagenome]
MGSQHILANAFTLLRRPVGGLRRDNFIFRASFFQARLEALGQLLDHGVARYAFDDCDFCHTVFRQKCG